MTSPLPANKLTSELDQLAHAQFGELSTAEVKVLQAAIDASVARCGPAVASMGTIHGPLNFEDWGAEHRIRSSLLRWLCMDEVAKGYVSAFGLGIEGAMIEGLLDLSSATVNFRLGLMRCIIPHGFSFRFASISMIDLEGARVAYLTGDHAKLKGPLHLTQSWCLGEIDLSNASIDGDLQCGGARFENPLNAERPGSGIALNAQNLSVTGSVFLRNGFVAEGAVWFLGAEIKGALDCSGAVFKTPVQVGASKSSIVFAADGAKIGGPLLLRHKFSAEGQVRLYSVSVGGDLDCDGGRFSNQARANVIGSGVAIDGSRLNIGGRALLQNGFIAEGEVSLSEMRLEGNLSCTNGQFSNPVQSGNLDTGTALDIKYSRIAGSVNLGTGCSMLGTLNLYRAEIRGDLNCAGARLRGFPHPTAATPPLALIAEGSRVGGSVLLAAGFAAEGVVWLSYSSIEGAVSCDGGSFKNCVERGKTEIIASGTALNLEQATIGRSVSLRRGFSVEGQVSLAGAHIGGNVECDGAVIRNPALPDTTGAGTAFTLQGAYVSGDIFLRDGFTAEGGVLLLGAEVKGDIDCSSSKFLNPVIPDGVDSGMAINAQSLKVLGSLFLTKGFIAEGHVKLFGADIGGSLECDGGQFRNSSRIGLPQTGLALTAEAARVAGSVLLRKGFLAEGQVWLSGAVIGKNLSCDGGKFSNLPIADIPQSGGALIAENGRLGGSVLLRDGFIAEGMVSLYGAQIEGSVECDGGSCSNPYVDNLAISGIAFTARSARVGGDVFLRNGFVSKGGVSLLSVRIAGSLDLQKGKIESLGLVNGRATGILDDEESWPEKGKLLLDGFSYDRILYGPVDASKRLEWLARQEPFTRHPYRQLAKVLKEAGDERGSRTVCSEMEKRTWDSPRKATQAFSLLLRMTIGYGYFSLRAIWWLLALMLLGSLIYWSGYKAGNMVPTNSAAYDQFVATRSVPGYYEGFHAIPYSLENCFPLVKLGIQDKWAPAQQSAPPAYYGGGRVARLLSLFSSPMILRFFRLTQICLGWILATLFVGGVTGLVRRD